MTARLHLYDTTLRDGQQTQGVQFTTAEKIRIANVLDQLGLDYIEGGWPGANPTDSDFFDAAPRTRATMTAFGMTKRSGRSADNDDVLAAVLNANTPAVCLVGKAHDRAAAMEGLPTANADVVLLDTMAAGDTDLTVDDVREASGGAKVVVYSGHEPEAARQFVSGEADLYLRKGDEPEHLGLA